MGVLGILLALLVVVKILGLLTWSWLLILFPLVIIIIVFLSIGIFFLGFFKEIFDNKK